MITTNEVFVGTKGADPVMPMVRWIREKGLVQGIDFDFKYHPRDWDQTTFEPIQPGVTFYFKEEKWATFMRLKYGNNVQGLEPGDRGVAG